MSRNFKQGTVVANKKPNYKGRANTTVDSTTHEGDTAVSNSPYEQLVACLLTSFNESTYYDGVGTVEKNMLSAIEELTKTREGTLFALKAVIYARKVANMRTMPMMALGAIAQNMKGMENQVVLETAAGRAFGRVDDVITVFDYMAQRFGRNWPKRLRNASASYLDAQKEYNLAKYQNKSGEFKLADVIKLARPQKYKDTLYKQIIEGTLKNTETWEAKLSAGEKKEDVFEDMITQDKIGYMALLRNLNNLSDVDETVFDMAIQILSDEAKIKKSKQLPFRFYSAYKATQGQGIVRSAKIAQAMSKAIEVQASAYDGIKDTDKVAVMVDCSGSMTAILSDNSSISLMEVGFVLAGALASRVAPENLTVIAWATGQRDVSDVFRKKNLTLMEKVADGLSSRVDHGTELYPALRYTLNKGQYDKIFVFTDSQLWPEDRNPSYYSGIDTTKTLNMLGNSHLYLINMAPYQTKSAIKVYANKVTCVDGWSEAIFTALGNTSDAGNLAAIIQEIEESIDLRWE